MPRGPPICGIMGVAAKPADLHVSLRSAQVGAQGIPIAADIKAFFRASAPEKHRS